METKDTISINISILGYVIPMTIERKDEEVYRRANAKVTTRIQEYILKYGESHRELVLAIVAYEMAFERERLLYNQDENPMVDTMAKLVDKIKAHLDE